MGRRGDRASSLAGRDGLNRAVGYLRISQDRDGTSLAPDRQRAAIAEAADRKGFRVVEWYEDRDISAYRPVQRPGFESMLAQLVGVQAIFVYELSRAARRTAVAAGLMDTLEAAGVRLVAVAQGLDSHETPRLLFDILFAADADESRRIARRTQAAHEHQTKVLGIHSHPRRTFGFDYDPATRTLSVDEAEAEVVREVVRRYLNGDGTTALARALNDGSLAGRVVPPAQTDQWRGGAVRSLLSSPKLAGFVVRHGQIVHPEPTQSAILDVDTWERLQAVRRTRASAGRRVRTEGHLLYGLARCACGSSMTANRVRTRPTVYRCTSRHAGRVCPDRASISLPWLDRHVTEWLFDKLDPAKEREHALADTATADVAEMRRQIAREERAIGRLVDEFADAEDTTADVVRQRIAERESKVSVYRDKLSSLDTATRLQAPLDVRWASAFAVMPLPEQREFLTAFVRSVVVRPGVGPHASRVSIDPRT